MVLLWQFSTVVSMVPIFSETLTLTNMISERKFDEKLP